MNGTFTADPQGLELNGTKIKNGAEEFTVCIDEIYNTVNEMVTNDYISPEAKEIANKIEGYKTDVLSLRNITANYGNFLTATASTVRANQENIIQEIR